MLGFLYVILLFVSISLAQVGSGVWCQFENNVCVAGLQRCGSDCNDCTFGTRCGFCKNNGNCEKTCNDLNGSLNGGSYEDYKRFCHNFKGY